MKFLSTPINYGWLRSNDPDAGRPGGAVSPAALGAVREADATMTAEDWVYAPAVVPAAGLPSAPPVPAGTADFPPALPPTRNDSFPFSFLVLTDFHAVPHSVVSYAAGLAGPLKADLLLRHVRHDELLAPAAYGDSYHTRWGE